VQPNARARGRWYLKRALASAITSVRDHRVAAMLARRPVPPLVLGYHRVVDDFAAAVRTEMPGMLVSRAMLERHLDWIGRRYRFVSLDEIAERAARGTSFTEPVAAVTFDDGYRDVYEHAYPMLKRKGIPAAVFVVTDLVGRPFWQIHDRLYRLVAKAYATWGNPRPQLLGLLNDLQLPAAELLGPRAATTSALNTVSALLPGLSYVDVRRVLDGLETAVSNGFGPAPLTLTWPMLTEMRRAGFVIGSHTESHVSLPAESADIVAKELEGSKRELERRLGEPIVHFAYPGGQFNRPVVEALDRAGYRFGYTACPHGDPEHPHLTIERLLLWERSSVDADGRFAANILSCQAHGLWPPARRCGRVHRV
jgi:peptidoglycan/xylan/chitin deacetylase (PgdA/CDA1 family)